MIKLNQKDKIIGWCFPDSKIQPDLPLISNQYPSKEVVLSMKPDFIFSGFLGTFKDERLGSRESLKKIGIETYISTSRCVEGQRPVTYDDFFKDIVNIGKIFNVEERATFLVDSIKQEIKSAKQNIKIQKDSLKILIFSGVYPTGEILVAGGYDISTSIVQEAGGKNIFKQEKKQELITSAEVILEKNPDIIVLKESLSDPNAALTRESLEKNSVLKNLKAVKNKNYVIVTFDSLLPGLNNIDALKKMIKEFYTSK
ncbi:MAG: ABC transporter substrate-binding protein [Bacteroidota bacterium]